jgi:hypothetical protein
MPGASANPVRHRIDEQKHGMNIEKASDKAAFS